MNRTDSLFNNIHTLTRGGGVMRVLLLFFVATLVLGGQAFAGAAKWYYDGSGTVTDLNNWGDQTDGSGTHPTTFTGGDEFHLQNAASVTLDAAWDLSSSKLFVGDDITGMQFTIPSGFAVAASCKVTVNALSTLTLQNTTVPDIQNSDATSTVDYAQSSGVTIDAANYGHLTISGSGTFTLAANIQVLGDLTIGSGATLADGGFNIQISGNWTDDGTFSASTGTVEYKGAGDQTVGAESYYILKINNATGVKILAGNATIAGNLTIQNGTLDIGTYTIDHILPPGGTLSVSNGKELIIGNSGGADNFPANFTTVTLNTSTVTYNGAGAQAVSGQTYGNLTLSGSSTKTLAGNTTVNAALSLQGTATFALGGFTLTYGGSGVLEYAGSSGQSTGPELLATVAGLTINNSSGVTLSSSASVSGTLTLTAGNVTTGANTLTLGTAVTTLGTLSRASGTIVGNFRRWVRTNATNNILFPVGTATYYRPANFSNTAVFTTGGTITAFFTASDPGTAGLPLMDGATQIVHCAPDGYWTLTSGDGLTGGTYKLDMTADGFSGVSVVTSLRLLKRPTGGGDWTLQGTHSNGTGTTGTPVVHRTGMTGFSEFGVGGASDNPLPIQLASFNAVAAAQNKVVLNWSTVSENNNYGFEVQKSASADEKYQTIPNSFVAGHGHTLEPQQYSYVDETAQPGVWYYRLKQMDYDGTTHYSEAVRVSVLTDVVEVAPVKFALLQNYPNPFNPETQITFTVESVGRATLRVYNLLGQEVASLFDAPAEPGRYYRVRFEGRNLPSGTYIYRLNSGQKVATSRMLLIK
jgi:hypothetical protein